MMAKYRTDSVKREIIRDGEVIFRQSISANIDVIVNELNKQSETIARLESERDSYKARYEASLLAGSDSTTAPETYKARCESCDEETNEYAVYDAVVICHKCTGTPEECNICHGTLITSEQVEVEEGEFETNTIDCPICNPLPVQPLESDTQDYYVARSSPHHFYVVRKSDLFSEMSDGTFHPTRYKSYAMEGTAQRRADELNAQASHASVSEDEDGGS